MIMITKKYADIAMKAYCISHETRISQNCRALSWEMAEGGW